MTNTKWKGILAKPMSRNLDGKELDDRINALFEYFGITEESSDEEIVRYKILVAMLAQQAKIPGFTHEKYKPHFLEETKEFIFWLEFTKLQLEKEIKSQLETASIFKYIDKNNEIIRFYQKKAEDTILDNYKNISKNNKLVQEFKTSEEHIYNCVLEELNKIPFKITKRYDRELRKGTKQSYLESINHILPSIYKCYFDIKKMFKKE